MPRWQVRYHRAILDSRGAVLYPAGAIIDSYDKIPVGQQDRVVVIESASDLTESAAAADDDEDEELE